ncbi:MAG: hypothetical protein GY934_16125, partial [Gammaproteobacteria bacterium]|nr:hypothetical protein [Gammaproteobacteria bacterium]
MQRTTQTTKRQQPASRLAISIILLFSLLGVTLTGMAGIFHKSSYVTTRGLMYGPNEKPIFSEVNENGDFVNDIGEAFGPYEKATVMSAISYRGLYEHFQQFQQDHKDDHAHQGARIMSAEEYRSTDLGTVKVPKVNWNGEGESYTEVSIPHVDLPQSIKSVLVRNANTIVDPNLLPPADGSILFRSNIDLRPANLQNLGGDIRSLLMGESGEVLFKSSHNIGFKSGFFMNEDGELSDSTRRKMGKDTVLGPVSGARVKAAMPYGRGLDVTGDDGKFRLTYYIPPCPGTTYDHSLIYEAELYYRNYHPGRPNSVGSYYFSRPDYHYCAEPSNIIPTSLTGQMAYINSIAIYATMATPIYPTDFFIDVIQLAGFGGLVGPEGVIPMAPTTEYKYVAPPGTKSVPGNLDLDNDRNYDYVVQSGDQVGVYLGDKRPVDENGNPVAPDLIKQADTQPDWKHQGLLKSISEEDLRETDLYVYRVSNGTLITKIEGMTDPSYMGPKEMEIHPDKNEFHYKIRIPGSKSWQAFDTFYGGHKLKWQEMLGTPEELSGYQFDALKPGEEIKIIAVNLPTGYIGSRTVAIQAAGGGILDFHIDPIIMRPPNLKIKAERIYTVEAGLTKDEKRDYLIGFEGSALTSDTMISIKTEWFDHDGMPLPEDLEGYTGRLAKVTSPNSVEGGEVQQFKIEPGKHLEVVKFQGDVLGTEHFYVHVSGFPEWRSAGVGAGDGPLKYRPANYVPFMVPILNEEAT